ncbi:MAG: PadR family transcriptional regulator [Vicingaceae bacterium]|nr:PadR family transcriptional regulator [Vicingaceae bacterium]
MSQDFIQKWNIQLKKGVLLYLVMTAISKKNSYGGEIIANIKATTGIVITEGTLYPILKKLKEEYCVLSKWMVDEENDSAKKYYYLTGKGNGLLTEMNEKWKALNISVEQFIKL